jgi:Ca-activated chloride channel family protein
LKYNLLTQYTSFIAVRELITNTTGSSQDVNQPLPLPVGVSDLAVSGTETGSEPGLICLLTAAIMVMFVMLLLRRRGTI